MTETRSRRRPSVALRDPAQLRDVMRERDVTAAECARAALVSYERVYQLTTGRLTPRVYLETAERLARFLRVDTGALFVLDESTTGGPTSTAGAPQ